MADETVSDNAVREMLEVLMVELSDVAFARDELVRERERRLKAIEEETRPRIEAVYAEFDTRIAGYAEGAKILKDSIAVTAQPRFMRLVKKGTKTIKLRAGEISHRSNAPGLDVMDAKALLRRLKRLGLLRTFTKVVRQVNTTMLKEALLDDPKLAAKIPEAHIKRREELYIRPGKTDASFTASIEVGSIDAPEQKED